MMMRLTGSKAETSSGKTFESLISRGGRRDIAAAAVWAKISRVDVNDDGDVTKTELRYAHADQNRKLRWDANASANIYEAWINDAETNQLVLRETGVTDSDFSALGLDDGNYILWIQDENSDGSGVWRERTELTVANGEVAVEAFPVN